MIVKPHPVLGDGLIVKNEFGNFKVISDRFQTGIRQVEGDLMDHLSITGDLIERTLRESLKSREVPSELAVLSLIQNQPGSPIVADQVFAVLLQIGTDLLNSHRTNLGLPSAKPDENHSPEQWLNELAMDFNQNNPELEAASAVFHRYLIPYNLSINQMAAKANCSTRNFRRRLENGLSNIARQVQLLEKKALLENPSRTLSRFLPLPDFQKLFGAQAVIEKVIRLLEQPDGPHFISIEGLGGIGKTALAQAVALNGCNSTELIKGFPLEGILWVSMRQDIYFDPSSPPINRQPNISFQTMISRMAEQAGFQDLVGLPSEQKINRLVPFLNKASHLVIMDNLESSTEAELMIRSFSNVTGPTRFLLTCRKSLQTNAQVYSVPLFELPFEPSRQLLEFELNRHGRNAPLSSETFSRLYEWVGGVPLALKLVGAQLAYFPVEDVEASFHSAHNTFNSHKGSRTEALFSHIYRQTWTALSREAQKLLFSIQFCSSDGETKDWLMKMSGLDPLNFENALRELRNFSLLEIGGKIENPVYRIHRLTQRFLMTDIAQIW